MQFAFQFSEIEIGKKMVILEYSRNLFRLEA